MQHIPHIEGYVVKLPELANMSSRNPVNPPQLPQPNPRETSEDGTAIVKATEHKSMNKRDRSIKIIIVKVQAQGTCSEALSVLAVEIAPHNSSIRPLMVRGEVTPSCEYHWMWSCGRVPL